MGLLDKLKPGYRNPDPRIRLEAVEELSDETILAEVAKTDDSPRVRLAAVARINDDEILAAVAKDAKEIDVRLAAVQKIDSQPLLADIIRSRKNYQLMGACFARITDKALLTTIAEDTAFNPAARRIAVEQFADESYLSDVADASTPETGGEERKSEAAVDAILATYGDMRVVRALGRFRGSEKALKALGTISLKGGEAGGFAVEYLCRALASSNPALGRCAAAELEALTDPEMVDCIVRSVDDPKLSEPIREVLSHIDTPQARAALGELDDGNES